MLADAPPQPTMLIAFRRSTPSARHIRAPSAQSTSASSSSKQPSIHAAAAESTPALCPLCSSSLSPCLCRVLRAQERPSRDEDGRGLSDVDVPLPQQREQEHRKARLQLRHRGVPVGEAGLRGGGRLHHPGPVVSRDPVVATHSNALLKATS